MERQAVVVRIEGEFAYLRIDNPSGGCGRCSEAGGCSSGLLNQLFRPACRLHKMPNSVNARVGERVQLVLPDGVVWRAAWVLYGVPLLLGLLGATLGRSDAGALAGLVVGLGTGCGLSAFLVRTRVWERYWPRMARIGHEIRFQEDVHR